MWGNFSKISKICIIYIIIALIYNFFFPSILGSQIDRGILKNIDTEIITARCIEYEKTREDEEFFDVYFSKHTDDSSVIIYIDVYDSNIYSKNAKIHYSWGRYKHPLEYDTVITVEKNNVAIIIYERTKDMRSRDAEIFLKEVFTELGV